MIVAPAVFFDGEVAKDHAVNVTVEGAGLRIEGPGVAVQHWPFGELEAVERRIPGRPFRLASANRPGARLFIEDSALIAEIVRLAPHLGRSFNPRHMRKTWAWVAGSIAGIAAAVYLTLQTAPQYLAAMLPDSWRDRMGESVEASLTGSGAVCNNPAGLDALQTMIARIAEGVPDLPPLKVKVYDVPVLNAFAMPGGRIVLMQKLVETAETPEEVAGVLAHEIGHVTYRHSEAQIIRATGLQMLLGLVTGGGSDALGSFAGIAAILRYSRAAEAEADAFALMAMEKAAIDPMGLKRFFETVLKEQGKSADGAFGTIESAFSTHPGTDERIGNVKPLPQGIVPRPVLDPGQFLALKAICKP